MGSRKTGFNFLLVGTFFIVVFLTGCMSHTGSGAGYSAPLDASPSRTPFLPENEAVTSIPSLDAGTPTSAATATGTATTSSTSTSTPGMRVELEAVGDIMLARTVGDQMKAEGSGIVFAGVQSVFDSGDILVGNLECALTTSGDRQPKSYTFSAPPDSAEALAQAGFDVLSLANNHAMDYGIRGLEDTLAALSQSGISPVGAGENVSQARFPVVLVRNGLRLAFLSYVDVPTESSGFDARTWIATASQPGIAWADSDHITADVVAAKLQADVVIVLLHSGYEIFSYIPSVSANQREEARAAIDAGAALVIGSHPHVLQSIEEYHGGLIAYSLGNFVFDGYEGIANASIILRVVLTPAGVQSYDWVPVLIKNGLPGMAPNDIANGIETLVAP